MKKGLYRYLAALVLAMVLVLPVDAQDTLPSPDRREEAVFQVSTINALLQGQYDGELSCGELIKQGDLGIGTFNGLDGEMIVLDGQVLKVQADGRVLTVAGEEKTPFATVAFFHPAQRLEPEGVRDLAALQRLLDELVVNRNMFYAFRIDGNFAYVKTRSVPKQMKPYPVLAEAAKNQSVFEMRNVQGTIVGFYCPPYVQGLNVPGYHLHFVSEDRTRGGHLLDCVLTNGTAQAGALREFHMVLPVNADFARANLTVDRKDELKMVESK